MALTDILPPAVTTGLDFVSSIINNVSQRKQYRKMLEYNSPKAQMARFKEAGLSPYLIYGQGNAGNVSSPSPAVEIPQVSGGLDRYTSWKNFQNEQKLFSIERQNRMTQGNLMYNQEYGAYLDNVRKQLEIYADYPAIVSTLDRSIDPSAASSSFRRKMNELKLSASTESVKKIQEAIRGMQSDNVVRRVKSMYASEYGMVGGDWTQGLGLIKSLPSFFKSRAKNPVRVKPVLVPKNFVTKP